MPLPPGSGDPREYGLTESQADAIWDRYGLTPSQFREQDGGLQDRILIRLEYPDLALERARYYSLAHFGDDGTIPDDAYSRASEQLRELREAAQSPRGLVAGLSSGPMAEPAAPVIEEAVAGLQPDNTGWKSLGPGNIGGRIRSIVIDPADPQRIYIGSVGGGVWVSTDGGQSWQPADDLMANLAVCCMAMEPTGNRILYAGTGEGYNNIDALRGNGIFRSANGWVWEQLPFTADKEDFRWVNGLAISNDSSIILAGTRTGIFTSTNGGALWTKRFNGNVGNLAFDPNDRTKAVAGLLAGGGIVYSTDGGTTWLRATLPAYQGAIGRIQVCYAAADTSRVYASVANTQGDASFSLIWASNDGGRTFTQQGGSHSFLGSQGWYDNVIWAGDPTKKAFVIVGGVDLWKSMDGGVTLTRISQWQTAPSSAHADHHAIVAHPRYNGSTNKTVYFGNDGSIYKADNVTKVGSPTLNSGWKFLGDRLPITQFYGAAGNPATMTVIGGAQDNGTLRYLPATGANNWTEVYGGDGGYVAADQIDIHNFYGEYVYLQIFRNTAGADPGRSEYICGRHGNVWKPAPFTIADARQGRFGALFIAPFLLDPNAQNRLLGGGASLWLTTDPLTANGPASGPTWTAIKGPVGGGAKISAIAVAPGNSDLVLVGYDNGRIEMSLNATAAVPTWARIDNAGINANRMCTWLAIDGSDNRRFYATFAGFEKNNVWTSSDSGAHWTSISGILPDAPVRCVTIHPQNPEWIYVGTEVGVFASEDRGRNWSPANAGATNCAISQLFWLGNTLYCASHGRGMFSIDLTIHKRAALVVTGDLSGDLAARDGRSGALVSNHSRPGRRITAPPALDGSVVYCGYAVPPAVEKFADARSLGGAPAWRKTLGGAVDAQPVLVKGTYPGDPDLLYLATSDGKLTVLNAATGASRWSLQVVPAGQVGAGVRALSCGVMNQWIYIATDRGFFAVNGQTRTVAWSNAAPCTAAPLAAANALYVPAQGGTLHAFDPRTGAQKWVHASGATIGSTPVWMLGSVVFGNDAGSLVGVAYNSGAVQFSASMPGEAIKALVADGDEIYFVGNAPAGHAYAYRMAVNGAVRTISRIWSANLALGSAALPPVVGDTLYITTAGGHLLSLDTISGAQNWSQQLSGVAAAAPRLVYA